MTLLQVNNIDALFLMSCLTLLRLLIENRFTHLVSLQGLLLYSTIAWGKDLTLSVFAILVGEYFSYHFALVNVTRHRGLRNYSKNCRPVVYLTYSSVASGKEFRDSVNFSRKRYRKLGEFAEKPLSREERAKRRRFEE